MTSTEDPPDVEDNCNSEPEQSEVVEPGSDEEDDCEGYFLEPSANNVNIAERIAEANRKLFEEEGACEENENRPRKVQFSDNLVDYEPACYYSDDDFVEESAGTSSNSEEDAEHKPEKDDITNEESDERPQEHEQQESPNEEDVEAETEEVEELNEELVESEENQEVSSQYNEENDEKPKRLQRPKTASRELKNKSNEIPITEEIEKEEDEGEYEEEKYDDAEEEIIDEVDDDVVIPFNGAGKAKEESELDDADICQSNNGKLLLVLLPREQSSSCESVIGEDMPDEEKTEDTGLDDTITGEAPKDDDERDEKTESTEIVKPEKPKVRPKSAREAKHRKHKKTCKVSKISPNLNYSYELETKKLKNGEKVKSKIKSKDIRSKKLEEEGSVDESKNGKVNIVYQNIEVTTNKRKPEVPSETKVKTRPRSSYMKGRPKESCPVRPRTAPAKRACCIVRTDLPQYNGLRSEYGLSAEQLQERRRRTFEAKQQKLAEKMHKRKELMQKRMENEERFSEWLHNKSRRVRGGSNIIKKPGKQTGMTDTLARSDVYIQSHAVYASRRGISYSVDYSINKNHNKTHRLSLNGKRHEKTVNLERLFDNVSPHVKRTYRIYLGIEPQK